MQQVSELSFVPAPLAGGDSLVRLGDRREVQMFPAARLQQNAGEIIDMQSLHDQHDGAFGRIVEARHQRRSYPFGAFGAGEFRVGLVGFQGIIDDNDVAAAASQLSTGRGGEPPTAHGRLQLVLGVLARADFEGGEEPSIPGAVDDGSEVVGMFNS